MKTTGNYIHEKMSTTENAKSASQAYLDSHQYTLKSILKYERIFGHTWVSTGGEVTTKEFCSQLQLKPGQKVLDIGCGTGGSAFFMARHYGCRVHGLDLSANMLSIANDRLNREEKIIQDRVTFERGDILEVQFSDNEFDVIYSRDTILHIREKEFLFRRILPWLKPNGFLLVTDYMKGNHEHSQEFLDYVKQRGYFLTTVPEFANIIKTAGFREVNSFDLTERFLSILEDELKFFLPTKEAFISDYSEEDFCEIVEGWHSKIIRVKNEDQAWGLFLCKK